MVVFSLYALKIEYNISMNVFETSKSILLKLVNEDVPFALALKNTFKKNNTDPAIKSNVAALVGCELRHHYIFNNLIERFFEGVEFEKTVYLRFLLANGLFLRRFSDSELLAYAEKDLDKVKNRGDTPGFSIMHLTYAYVGTGEIYSAFALL